MQNGTPIYFASRAISPTELNYQNFEHETLGTIWGMENSIISYMVTGLHWK